MLCLFDPDTPVVELEDALTIIGLDRSRRKDTKLTSVRSTLSLSDLVEAIQTRCHGICVAAHVTSRKGILKMEKGGARADYWRTENLLAAQLPCAPAQLPNAGLRSIVANEDAAHKRLKPLAYVLTSDARSEAEIGTESVWIKMHRPSVAGLRQAFLDPGSRIAFTDPMTTRTDGRLLSASWEGGYLRGSEVLLNPELTCLIGGKGTGKSTVIESVRWAFGLDPNTVESKQAVGGLREFALPAGSQVIVTFETGAPSSQRFTVERTAPHAPIVRDAVGQQQPDLDPSALLHPRIYGQKEIFEVAQSAEARLALVDAFAESDLRDVADREKEVVVQLSRNRRDLMSALQELEQSSDRLAALPSLLQWRERFRQAGFEKRLRERRLLEREAQLLSAADTALLERQRLLADLEGDLPLPPDLSGGRDAADLPNNDLIDGARQEVASTISSTSRGLKAAGEELQGGRERLAAVREQWEARRAARQSEFDQALRQLQADAPDTDPEQYLDVERRIEQLEPLHQRIKQLEARAEEARRGRDALLVDLRNVRADKHRRRVDAADQLSSATARNVKVEVHYQRDRDKVLERLQALKTKARGDALTRMVEHAEFSPAEFARKVRERTLTGAYDLTESQASLLERTLDNEALLDLEPLELRDETTIALDVGPPSEPAFRELERLSPGQKSTAILLLILQSSREPLLVDQPEDDLDNRFIYDDVVQRLRAAKRHRQVVVATHNANIPVLGDAEQIIVLEARADPRPQGFPAAQGTVDDVIVREQAEQILEGGEEAFQLRRQKYGW